MVKPTSILPKLLTLSISLGLTVIFLEVALRIFALPQNVDLQHSILKELETQTFAEWWILDEAGSYRFNAEALNPRKVKQLTRSGSNWARLSTVNQAGYCDVDEFNRKYLQTSELKLLVIGDSFTWGASASHGASFVELLDEFANNSNQETVIWNASIPATGIEAYKHRLETLGPEMEPDIVLLGLCFNDVFQLPSKILRTDSGKAIFHNGSNLEEACEQIRSQIQADLEQDKLFGFNSRLYALLNNFRSKNLVAQRLPDPSELEVQAFTKHLTDIQSLCTLFGSELLALNIPDRVDLMQGGSLNQTILGVLDELDIEVVDPTQILDPHRDYQALPDPHWNDQGHQKAGQLLIDYLQKSWNQTGSR